MLALVHISDLHLGKPFVPEIAEALLRRVHALECDAIVVSGDLTQRAKEREFVAARALLDRLPDVPRIVVPGNHDVPLYRVWERLTDPLGRYRAHIAADVDTVHELEHATIVALDSTDPYLSIKNGRLVDRQLAMCRREFEGRPPGHLKVVVFHHHVIPAPTFARVPPMRRAKIVLRELSDMQVDLVLAGHLHRSYVGNSLDVFAGTHREHGIVVVHCGTSSSRRGRGFEREKNTFNLVRVTAHNVHVDHFMYFTESDDFVPISRHVFRRSDSDLTIGMPTLADAAATPERRRRVARRPAERRLSPTGQHVGETSVRDPDPTERRDDGRERTGPPVAAPTNALDGAPRQSPHTRVFTIINPVAGSSNPELIEATIRDECQSRGLDCEVLVTDADHDVTAEARRAIERGFDRLVAAGGDGTVAAVGSALVGTRVTLGIVPAGTANLLAREFSIPLELAAASRIAAGLPATRSLDAMHVGDRYFFSHLSIGLYSQIAEQTSAEAKRRLRRIAYVWNALPAMIQRRSWRFRMSVDGRRVERIASSIMVANVGAFGAGTLRWGPGIEPDDGVLDICIVRARSLGDYVRAFWSIVRRRQRQAPEFDYLHAQREIEIEASRNVAIRGDGEVLGHGRVAIALLPAALQIAAVPDPASSVAADTTSSRVTNSADAIETSGQ